jgi:hypothetical protein
MEHGIRHLLSVNGRQHLLLAVSLAFAGTVQAQAPDPPWQHADAPVRVVFQAPANQRLALVEIPAGSVVDGQISRVAAYHGASPRSLRVAATNAGAVSVLVNCEGLAPQAVVALYAITNTTPLAPDCPFVDPQPVSVSIQRAGANEAPPTWEEMRFMSTRPGRQPVQFPLEGFIPVVSNEQGPRNWYQGGWRRPVYVAKLSGKMLIPASGEFRFAVKSRKPVYLLLQDKLVFQVGSRSRKDDDWMPSDPIPLRAGILDYTVLTLCDREINLNLGWIPPGTDAIVELPQAALLTGADPVAARVERIGATLHAGADYALEPSYVFYGHETRFTPVSLRSIHAAWEGAQDVSCLWKQAGATLGETPRCRIIATNTGALPVDLEVRNKPGACETARLTVVIPDTIGNEYRLATRLQGVPAICYDDDPVQPEIHLRGTAPDSLPLTLTAWTTTPEGVEKMYREVVTLQQGWTRLVLPVGTAHDFTSIRWTVSHAGVTVNNGAIRFLRQPFEALPDDLDGSFMVMGEASCVLMPRRASSGHPAPFTGLRPGQQITLLDGFLAPPGLGGEDNGLAFDRQFLSDIQVFGAQIPGLAANSIRYRRQSVESLKAFIPTRTFDRLAPLTQLARLNPADIVVVAPDMPGLAAGETLEDFERRLAALAGLLRDALPAQVVLMTPPPGLLPADMRVPTHPGEDPMRPYAEAVLRVADALGITVADFYTMCHTREATPAVVDGTLTNAGRRLAAETLARTLAGGR